MTLQPLSNLSNAASLLWHAYKSLQWPSSEVNWAGTLRYTLDASRFCNALTNTYQGFYVVDKSSPRPQLILAPFQGKVACQIIPFGRGVCGVAAQSQLTQLVQDVNKFPGHIACDGASKSEIVVPILIGQPEEEGSRPMKTVAIIDIDCAVWSGFDDVDRRYLEKLAALLSRSCDW